MKLHELAANVRRFWTSHPQDHVVRGGISRAGKALLEAVEALPTNGVVVPLVVLARVDHQNECPVNRMGMGNGPCDCVRSDLAALLGDPHNAEGIVCDCDHPLGTQDPCAMCNCADTP